jgi:pimeloyl-ACP methyl ester carboxylesterase
MTTLILVHGACHGGWCWERVVPLLEAKGLRVLAPDMPDLPPGEKDPVRRWGAVVAELAEREAAHDRVVVVGHSRGGVVISAAADAAPHAISGLIYVAASLLPRSQTMNGAWRAFSDQPAEWVAPAVDGLSFTIAEGVYHRLFCPMSDAATAAHAEAQLRAEPIAAFMAPLRISADRFGRVQRAYVETSRDAIIPLAFQRSMQAALPCGPVLTLDSDHMPMLAMPERLAEALLALAGGGIEGVG